MNKKIDIGLVKKVFSLTKRIGIETFAYFMIGYIRETDKSYKKTLSLALSLDIDLAMFTIATPYPGTPFYDMVQSKNLIEKDYWKNFTLGVDNSERLPYFINNAESLIKDAYCKFYLRPRIILRKIKELKSFTTLKKYFNVAKGLLFFKTI
jgi:radical SAM superfamily enzyme YgiQ (UPF0313 family)